MQAGQSTIVLGSCEGSFRVGWNVCYFERRSQAPMPTLRMVMTNPGDYAVSDCEMGLFKTGSVDKAGLVEVDLTPLRAQFEKHGFCILKLETAEKFRDPMAPGQIRTLFQRGGFVAEMIQPGYFPVPSNVDTAFCVQVSRTTNGRTRIDPCPKIMPQW